MGARWHRQYSVFRLDLRREAIIDGIDLRIVVLLSAFVVIQALNPARLVRGAWGVQVVEYRNTAT